jgi:uncharacterized membrane protein YhaH (DUF805 family)
MVAMSFFHLLVRFDGRINRARYWLVLILFLPLTLTVVLDDHEQYGPYVNLDDVFRIVNPAAIGRALDAVLAIDLTSPATLPVLVRLIVTPLVAWCFLIMSIKRLHDRDRSGWWMVPFVILPGLFKQLSPLTVSASNVIAVTATALAVVAVLGLYIWGIIELFVLKGTTGTNRFGPDPLAGGVT